MKKTFLAITALAAMLFAGCTSSDELTTLESIKTADNTPTPVQFGTYMGKTGTTRSGSLGEIITPSSGALRELGTTGYEFGVIAYNHVNAWASARSSATPNFMYNQKVLTSDNGTTWTYSPVKYWPNGEDSNNSTSPSTTAEQDNTYGKYVSFFAYAPYVDKSSALTGTGITKINNAAEAIGSETSGSGNTKVDEPTVDYSLVSSSNGFLTASNVDLLWGLRNKSQYDLADGTDAAHAVGTTYNTDLTKQNTTEKVSFLFKHALAKLGGSAGLKIVADFDGNGSGATGNGSKDATTLITVKSITIGNVANAVTTSGTFNLATGTWTATNNGSIAASTPIALAFNADGSSSNITLNSDIAEAVTTSTSNCPIWSSAVWKTNNGSGAATETTLEGVTQTAKNVYSTTGDAFYLIPGQSNQQLTITVDYIVRTYDANLAVPTNEVSRCSKVEQIITNVVTLPAATLASNKFFTLVIHLGLTSVKFTASVASWDDNSGAGNNQEIWLPSNVVPTP